MKKRLFLLIVLFTCMKLHAQKTSYFHLYIKPTGAVTRIDGSVLTYGKDTVLGAGKHFLYISAENYFPLRDTVTIDPAHVNSYKAELVPSPEFKKYNSELNKCKIKRNVLNFLAIPFTIYLVLNEKHIYKEEKSKSEDYYLESTKDKDVMENSFSYYELLNAQDDYNNNKRLYDKSIDDANKARSKMIIYGVSGIAATALFNIASKYMFKKPGKPHTIFSWTGISFDGNKCFTSLAISM
ncbi:MAG: hypothetical protein ABI772_12495 [Bacteroidota bacterium]